MEVKDKNCYTLYTKEKIGNQTFYMEFSAREGDNLNNKQLYVNIYMTLYNKRTQTEHNESNILSTGNFPMETIIVAKKAFHMLEDKFIDKFSSDKDITFYITWYDTKRRNVYYKYLNRYGYSFGNIYGKKALIKRVINK